MMPQQEAQRIAVQAIEQAQLRLRLDIQRHKQKIHQDTFAIEGLQFMWSELQTAKEVLGGGTDNTV